MESETVDKIFLIAMVSAIVLIILIKLRAGYFSKYQSKVFLNSKAEQNFLTQLLRVLPEKYSVSCKVRLADVVEPTRKRDKKLFGDVVGKHIDFVVYELESSRIVMCIELDDSSHDKWESRKRDRVKNNALKEAKLNLYRVRASRSYSRALMASILGSIENKGVHNTSKTSNKVAY